MVLATYFTHLWVHSDLPCDVVFDAAVLLSAALFVLVPAFDAPVLCVLLCFTAVEVLFFVLLLLSELFFFTVLSADEDAVVSDVSDFDVPEPDTFSSSFTVAAVSSDCVSPAVSVVLSVLFCVSDTVASCVSDCILLLLLPAVPHEAAENTTVIASIAVMIFSSCCYLPFYKRGAFTAFCGFFTSVVPCKQLSAIHSLSFTLSLLS